MLRTNFLGEDSTMGNGLGLAQPPPLTNDGKVCDVEAGGDDESTIGLTVAAVEQSAAAAEWGILGGMETRYLVKATIQTPIKRRHTASTAALANAKTAGSSPCHA